MKKKFPVEQIVSVLKQAEVGVPTVEAHSTTRLIERSWQEGKQGNGAILVAVWTAHCKGVYAPVGAFSRRCRTSAPLHRDIRDWRLD
jgi:hypothetical protein